jgi:hypothetical protein
MWSRLRSATRRARDRGLGCRYGLPSHGDRRWSSGSDRAGGMVGDALKDTSTCWSSAVPTHGLPLARRLGPPMLTG